MHDGSGERVTFSSPGAESDFTRLFNLSLDLLCIAGLDGYFRRVNPSWTRVLGWSEAELLARPVASFMHPEDRERTLEARQGLARGIPVCGLENRYLCKDGSYRWLSWQSIAEPRDQTVFAVARDITDRRQLDHERLVRSKLDATRILAGGIAHDFNNLLTGVGLNLDMVTFAGPVTEGQAEHIRRAQHALQVAKALTDRLVALANSGDSQPAACDLRVLLQSSAELVLTGAGLEHACHIAPDLWAVKADELQIAEVIRGLLLNAREACTAGQRVQLVAENVTGAGVPQLGEADTAGRWVRIQVSDTGAGIAAGVLSKVFDPYFSTKQRGAQKGMGLGLTTCRAIVEAHGGRITLESQAGRGTTVTCLLPAGG
jgi:PAS domain S-box-containing protein